MLMEVLLRELLARIGLLSLVRNSRRVFGGQKVVMSSSGCESTKGLVCPSLAHALHSQNLRSLRGGALEGKEPSSWPRAWVAPLPASSGRCLVLRVSASMTRDNHPNCFELGEGWPGAEGREWIEG